MADDIENFSSSKDLKTTCRIDGYERETRSSSKRVEKHIVLVHFKYTPHVPPLVSSNCMFLISTHWNEEEGIKTLTRGENSWVYYFKQGCNKVCGPCWMLPKKSSSDIINILKEILALSHYQLQRTILLYESKELKFGKEWHQLCNQNKSSTESSMNFL